MKTKKTVNKIEGLDEIRQSGISTIYGGKSISDRLKDQLIVCCIDIPPMSF
ncbi:hypothetical protein LJC00_00350 [Dysgonomonas sp. OttesenSCG-928-M03]|nr:hypothetical protein [Dysgonomonas sp. OttesenSCG-928-M03]